MTGLTVGKLVSTNHDALAFASADANLVTVLDVSGPAAPASPVKVPVSVLGPSAVLAMGIGGPGSTPLHDLYLGSIYNSDPTPNRGTLFRNDGTKFSQLAEVTLSGAPARANRIALKFGQPEVMAMLVSEEKGAALRVESLSSGKPEALTLVANLPAGSDYAVGNFRGSPLCEFVFYTAGGSNLTVRPVEEPSPGKFQVGAGGAFSLGQPIKQIIAVPNGGSKLLVIFGKGETAGVFNFLRTSGLF